MKMNPITKSFFAMTFIAALAACSTGQRAKTAEVATRGAGAVSELSGPTEAEIIHVLATVNNSEIEAAQLAKTKSQDKNVISLANHIITDHGAMNRQLMDLSQRLNIQPDGNEISKSIRAGSAATMASLRNASGNEFNEGFMQQQVSMHQSTLRTIDDRLLPNAQNPELKTLLQRARASIVSHLDHAQTLQRQTGTSNQ